MENYYTYSVTGDSPEKTYKFLAPLWGDLEEEMDLHDRIDDKIVKTDRIRILKIDQITKQVICISIIDEA